MTCMELAHSYKVGFHEINRPYAAPNAPYALARSHTVELLQQRTALARDTVAWQQPSLVGISHSYVPRSYIHTGHSSGLEPLQRLVSPEQYEDLLVRHPEVLTCIPSSPISSWIDFLDEFGLDCGAIGKLLLQCPEILTCTSIYEAGRTLLFFRQLGWRYEQIKGRIIAQYPQVLSKQIERDIQPVVQELLLLGSTPHDIKLLVWEYPRIFTVGKDYRRHIRKFQYLELYGLKLPGQDYNTSSRSSSKKQMDSATGSESGSGSDSDGYCSRRVTDSLEWLLMTVQN